jgi:hypothetical protein
VAVENQLKKRGITRKRRKKREKKEIQGKCGLYIMDVKIKRIEPNNKKKETGVPFERRNNKASE